jgi:hypothetical protein
MEALGKVGSQACGRDRIWKTRKVLAGVKATLTLKGIVTEEINFAK